MSYEFYCTIALPAVPSSGPTLALYDGMGQELALPSGTVISQCGATAVYVVSVPQMPAGTGGALVIRADGVDYATVVSPRESEYADVPTSSRSTFDPATEAVEARFTAVSASAQGLTGTAALLPVTRFADWMQTISAPISADWVRMYWTIKQARGMEDGQALLQVRVSNPAAADDGIQVLNGQARAALQAEDATLFNLLEAATGFVVDAGAGEVALRLDALMTGELLPGGGEYVYDLKEIEDDADAYPIVEGSVTFGVTVTHAVA